MRVANKLLLSLFYFFLSDICPSIKSSVCCPRHWLLTSGTAKNSGWQCPSPSVAILSAIFFFLVLKSVTSTLCLHSNLLAWQENSVCSSKCHILSISLISHRNMTTKSIFSSLLCNHRYSIWSTIFPKNFLQITKSAEKKR